MIKISLFVLAAALMFSSCRYVTGKRIRGNGNVKTEERTKGNFKSVASHGSFNIYVSIGNPSVRIEAEENLLPYIETHVDGSVLYVGTKDNFWLSPGREVKIFVSAPDFESIHSYGSGDIIGQSKITNPSNLELEINGSANIKMNVDAPAIDAETNGSGDIDLEGETKSFDGEIRGSGNIKAMDLKSENAKIKIYGSGDADVFAASRLDVDVAGSGDVRYKGNAQVSSSIAGSGKIRKVE
ncbi:MAG TPA: head GIN domain-containing protein [Chitinophagaceae bacterium]|nr:head GIN domain-containing protein [Chitinophagaceae bacterium]